MCFTCYSAWLPNVGCSTRDTLGVHEAMILRDCIHIPERCQAILSVSGCPTDETLQEIYWSGAAARVLALS